MAELEFLKFLTSWNELDSTWVGKNKTYLFGCSGHKGAC
jgi:hypothetical protein